MFWPNNGKADCPKLVDQVDFSGPGEDGVLAPPTIIPDNETSRGGPHFVVHDGFDRYVATSNYFVDLRKFAIKDVDVLLSALGLGHAWQAPGGFDNSYPPGGPNAGDFPPGGLGAAFQLLDDNNLLPFKTGGWASVLPGTGSVGDDTVCMMRWNRWTGNLELDSRFNAGDATSPKGCNDMDFGDTGKQWPANGTRHADGGQRLSARHVVLHGRFPPVLQQRRDRPRHPLHAGTGIVGGEHVLIRSGVAGSPRPRRDHVSRRGIFLA